MRVYCHLLRGKVGDPKFVRIKIYPTDKVRQLKKLIKEDYKQFSKK